MTQNTTVLVCTAISLVTTGIGYLWGWFRTKKQWDIHIKRMVALCDMLSKQRDQWADNYWKLEKDIECTVHETHEEVEKPFVDARWLSGELVPPEEERTFLDSVYGKEPDRREPGVGC